MQSRATGLPSAMRSRIGGKLAHVPLALLIGFEGFRLPLELAMHHGAGRGVSGFAIGLG